MTDTITLNPEADDQQLLAQVVACYQRTLKATPEALDYLTERGIRNGQAIDQFRIGYADRSLGLKLPSKDSKAGVVIRTRLQQIGLFRESGHEHFAGSIAFPICAADGTGRIIDIYGRKLLGKRLRKGTPIHMHLNEQGKGVWNVEAFGATDEIVLCGSLWDALTFWSHGYRNATCTFNPETLNEEMLAAFVEFKIERVLTTCDKLTEKLLGAGLDVFLLKLPPGMDVNAYARQVSDPADALGGILRAAEWVGRGQPTTKVSVPFTPVAQPQQERGQAERLDGDGEVDEQEQDTTPVRNASPVPPAPPEVEAEVSDDEVVVTFGNRRFRVRGLAKNTAVDVLRVSSCGSCANALKMLMAVTAYALVVLYRQACRAVEGVGDAEVQTLRERLWKVPAEVVRRGGVVRVSVPRDWEQRETWEQSLRAAREHAARLKQVGAPPGKTQAT